jgi:cobalt-zinc-cadmium efflux system protein
VFRKEKSRDLNVKAAYGHLLADAAVSGGVVVSGLLIHYTGWYVIDGLAALLVAAFVLLSTWSLWRESINAVLDGVPPSVNPEEIRRVMSEVPGVQQVHHIHIWPLSTRETALTAHVLLADATQLPQVKQNLKAALKTYGIAHSTLECEFPEENCPEAAWR